MTDPPKSPSPATVPRATAKLFHPHDANALSTRGQHLPALFSRRPSTIRSNEHADEDESLLAAYDSDAERRHSVGAQVLNTPQMRSQRLIGNSNPRYKWEKYYKSDEELKGMKRPMQVQWYAT
jgi:hypothetical protein